MGPAWLCEQSCNAIDRISSLLQASRSGTVVVPPDYSLLQDLGESWVALESSLYQLVCEIDAEHFVFRGRG